MSNQIIDKFRENSRGFWKDYHWLIIIFALAITLDGCSTIYFMVRDGTEAEFHPAIQFVSERILGPVGGPLFTIIFKLAAGILVTIYYRKLAVYIFLAASIISMWAAWYNIWGHNFYTPYFLKFIPW